MIRPRARWSRPHEAAGLLWDHLRQLWPGPGIWLPVPFMVWSAAWLAVGKGRLEHVIFLIGMPLLAYTNTWTRRLLLGLLPMAFLGLVYDGMRWFDKLGVTPDRVHVCDLREVDMNIASATVNGERGTVHDWIQAHTSTALDIMAAIPYGTFLFVAVGFAVFLYVKDYERMRLFGWAFFFLNLAGFATYHLYPAAAPWYFHTYGCAVDLTAHPSEGPNLARVDVMLGVPYFRSFYGRAADVFGAVPSLHVSYPMLIILFGWPVLRWPGRILAIVFLVTMCTAAVYLDHHWIIDVILGLAYTVAVHAAIMVVVNLRQLRAPSEVMS